MKFSLVDSTISHLLYFNFNKITILIPGVFWLYLYDCVSVEMYGTFLYQVTCLDYDLIPSAVGESLDVEHASKNRSVTAGK